jgi:tRNA pseudouridine38-40 synthase
MTQRYALGVQYDGREWLGWQSQPGAQTVQDTLELALSRFVDETVRVTAAGRTDSGVHAIGQVVHLDTGAVRADQSWVRATNSLLPASIAVTWARAVSEGFHARFSAIARTYYYVLHVAPVRSPHCAGRAGWCHAALDIGRMRRAAQALVGQHDFSALRSAQCQAKSPIKTVHELELLERGSFIVLRVRADAFLHHMVRNLVGCLVAVGRGREQPEWLAEVIDSRDRARAAATYAPDGLYLADVEYPAQYEIPRGGGLDAVFPGLLSVSQ